MSIWPLERDCMTFYGDPGLTETKDKTGQPVYKADPNWMAKNLVSLLPPFAMTYAGKPIKSITIHKKCSESLARVLQDIWKQSGQNQHVVDDWGASIFSGSFVPRMKRGMNKPSMHSWGCAIDLDAQRNGLNNPDGHFRHVPQVLNAFAREGWTWGGTWKSRPDPMHFQAAL